MAAPSLTGTPATKADATFGLNHSLTYTCDATGTNRALIALIGPVGNNGVPTSVTYDGVAMTQLTNMTGLRQTDGLMYFLANPPTGAALTLAVTYSANRYCFFNVFTVQDCAQSSPLDVSGQNNTAGATSLSKSITTTVADTLCITWIQCQSAAGTLVEDAGQVDLGEMTSGGPGAQRCGASYEVQASAGSYTGGYTFSSANGDIYVANLKGASGGGGTVRDARMLSLLGAG